MVLDSVFRLTMVLDCFQTDRGFALFQADHGFGLFQADHGFGLLSG